MGEEAIADVDSDDDDDDEGGWLLRACIACLCAMAIDPNWPPAGAMEVTL